MWNFSFIFIFFLSSLVFSKLYAAETIRVATASNFLPALKNLKQKFESEVDIDLIIISGSTSKLYAQISNGAPFDIFLSADQLAVKKLLENAFAVKNSEFVYATGKLALWGADENRTPFDLKNDLQDLNFKRLAIANPKLAPYGQASIEVLKKLSLHDKVKTRMVYGENIGQTFQFVYSGNVELGFVAMSQLKLFKHVGQYWEIPLSLYQPLKQSAVLLNRAKNKTAAKSFLFFLKSREVQQIISSQFGYLASVKNTHE